MSRLSQALSSLSAHDVSIDVSTVEIPVGLKGRTYQFPHSQGLLDFAWPSDGIVKQTSWGEDVFIGFSAPVAYVLC
jgi:hypothetical protein